MTTKIGFAVQITLAAIVFGSTASAHSIRGKPDLRTFEEVDRIEVEGPHNHLFTISYDYLASKMPDTKDELGIDSKVFVGSQKIIVDRAAIPFNKGPEILNPSGHKFYVRMFSTFYSQLRATFMNRLSIPENAASVLATELERQAVTEAGLDYAEYLSKASRKAVPQETVYQVTRQVLEDLYSTSTIIGTCDVPYIAGYDFNDGQLILIDRMVPLYNTFAGQTVPVGRFLNIHERVEKAILDDYQTRYPHAHQIALRIEKLSSDALGSPWKAYDNYITQVANEMDSRVIEKVYVGLDFAPYLTWNRKADAKLVIDMRNAYVDISRCPVSAK